MKLSLLYGGKYRSQNLFFPIYQQLEKELMELSRLPQAISGATGCFLFVTSVL
jgi:hypothetical protein